MEIEKNSGSIYESTQLNVFSKDSTVEDSFEDPNNFLLLGNVAYDYGELEKALNFYQKALKIYEFNGDEKGVAQCLGWTGLIYKLNGEFSKALNPVFV